MRLLLLIISGLFLFSENGMSANFIEAPPFSKSIQTKGSACGESAKVRLPFITWGGDIATIFANGGTASTKPDSLFGKAGLKLEMQRQDVFATQLEQYMSCQSPFLRGTLAMMHMASEITEASPMTKLRVFYQMTWSAGGDALVVKDLIKSPKDLKGKTIALQAYGPHIDYLGKVLMDAGLSFKDVTIKWVKDITGTDQSPANAIKDPAVAAVMLIIPDALAVTSGGTVGTGAEDSFKGARILLSTKSANRVITDVYAVREDYFMAHKDKIAAFTKALLEAETALAAVVKDKASNKGPYDDLMKSAAKLLLDSDGAIVETQGMYQDAQFVGAAGNISFFKNPAYPRSFKVLNAEIQVGLKDLGLLTKDTTLSDGGLDFQSLDQNKGIPQKPKEKFDANKLAQVVEEKDRKGTLSDGALFSFQVYFGPNQNDFSESQYEADFKKVVELASTYGGAIITVEGHSDPLGFLKQQKAGAANVVLQKLRQAGKNLSLTRANKVRDSIVSYAANRGIALDKSQFAVIGHGIAKPASGLCGNDPCAPKTKEDWLSNMRVEFKLIQIEAEEQIFTPM